MSVIEEFFNVFAPHECIVCREEGNLLCTPCAKQLKKIPERCYVCSRRSQEFRTCKTCRRRTPLFGVWAVTGYEGPAKELLRALKFGRAKASAKTIASIIFDSHPLPQDVVITYIPTAQSRVRERGYDQAALIAKSLAAELGIPCLPLLARTGGQRQLGKSRADRKKQMDGAFRPLGTINLHDRHVLLVDDVLTTGATCEAAARTLRENGAKQVSAVVFAVA